MKIVILAGGAGTRLWPMSRSKKPKQFYDIISEQPMIVDTYERFIRDFPQEDIFIACNDLSSVMIKKLFPQISLQNIIIDPVAKKDTAPAMGYACLYLEQFDPDEPIVFIPSDHYIANIPRFIETLKIGETIIRETGKMIDIGIQPNFPSTVLGYTKIGEKVKKIDGVEIYEFKGHKEKPSYKQAKEYLDSNEYLWHANFYMWTPRNFLNAYKKYAPKMHEVFDKIRQYLKEKDSIGIKGEYDKCEKLSIDYAVTEKMAHEEVYIIKGDFGWSDIGAWDVLYDKMSLDFDKDDNLIKGECLPIDTHKTLVYGLKDKLIAVIGLDNMIIVDTKDVLLVCPQGRAQEVKKAVSQLKSLGKNEFL